MQRACQALFFDVMGKKSKGARRALQKKLGYDKNTPIPTRIPTRSTVAATRAAVAAHGEPTPQVEAQQLSSSPRGDRILNPAAVPHFPQSSNFPLHGQPPISDYASASPPLSHHRPYPGNNAQLFNNQASPQHQPRNFSNTAPIDFNGGHLNPAFVAPSFFAPTQPMYQHDLRWSSPYSARPNPSLPEQSESRQKIQQPREAPRQERKHDAPRPNHFDQQKRNDRRSASPNRSVGPANTRSSSPPLNYDTYVQPQRRVKQVRNVPIAEPTEAYLAAAGKPTSILSASAPPPCIVLDLNNTLLFRKKRSASGSKSPVARPYLSTFLSYLASHVEGKPRWISAVYSSARVKNVLSLLSAIGLVDHKRAESMRGGQAWEEQEGDFLAMVWSREKMGLTPAEFEADIETTKDLEALWRVMGGDLGPERTILLDDEDGKAATQPYNHLPIEPFLLDPASLPPTTPPPRWASLPNSNGPDLIRASATEIPPEHPCGEDTALLSSIYLLEQLRRQSNIANFIREGGLEKTEIVDQKGQVEWAKTFCEAESIPISRDWDPRWNH